VTPVSQSELARDALGDAQLFVFPGFGHGPSFDSPCAAQMTAAFLRDSGVSSSCWSSLPQDTF
jgi:pimeloyl-ACP methyl ester carboxylesterase